MRNWFKKWQNVIVWTLAISFVAGIAWWSVASYISGRSRNPTTEVEAVGYVAINGQIPKDSIARVSTYELDMEYANFLSGYSLSALDALFEEPEQKAYLLKEILKERAILLYAKENKLLPTKKEIEDKLKEYRTEINKNQTLVQYIKQRYGSVDNYLDKTLRPSIEKTLTLEKVKNKVANVSEEEMKKYFEEHLEDIKIKYDTANVKLAWFEKENEAKKFISLLSNMNFDQAASKMNVQTTPLSNLRRGLFDKEVDEKIFSATPGSIVGPFKLSDTWIVAEVKEATIVKDFASFALSDFYETERSTLRNQALEKWYESYVESKKVELRIVNEVLSTWDKINQAATQSELLKLEEELSKKIFSESVEISPDVPDTLKSAYVTLVEKIQDFDGNIDGTIKKKREVLVRYLYEQYPSSLHVARRMYEIDRGNTQVKYNYFTLLYSSIKPYIAITGPQVLLQNILEIEAGLASIMLDTSVATDLRASACYNLYDLSKELKDATSAKFYLDQLRKLNPNYIDFEAAVKELEEMKKSSEQKE
ncbi:MAG: hypothetical protein N2250_01270 [Pseudothermotoga sp.]|nr:hypothetical protein [Pseudothermotoga sp.]